MKYRLLFLFLAVSVFFLIPTASAQCTNITDSITLSAGESPYVHLCRSLEFGESFSAKQNDDYTILIPVIQNNLTKATSATSCQMTVRHESTIVVNDQEMNFTDGGIFNFTILGGFLGSNGDYLASMNCNDGSETGFTSFKFIVTPTGKTGLLGFFIIAIILSYGIMIFGIRLNDITISMLGTFALIFMSIFILFFGIDVFKNEITFAFGIISLGIAFYVSTQMGLELVRNM